MGKKINKQYWFSVEGNTEEWYLDHLQHLINTCGESKYTVSINHKRCTSPKSYIKQVVPRTASEVIHLCDIESTCDEHMKNFSNVLQELQFAQKARGVKYSIGYTNYTFELWIILHKKLLTTHLSDRNDYLKHINAEYSKKFCNLSEYKEKRNFQTVLECIDLDSVKIAIDNAERIEELNDKNGVNRKDEYGVKYYVDNPSLSIHKAIDQILKDCKLRQSLGLCIFITSDVRKH